MIASKLATRPCPCRSNVSSRLGSTPALGEHVGTAPVNGRAQAASAARPSAAFSRAPGAWDPSLWLARSHSPPQLRPPFVLARDVVFGLVTAPTGNDRVRVVPRLSAQVLSDGGHAPGAHGVYRIALCPSKLMAPPSSGALSRRWRRCRP